jgi:hypothetical protein
VIYSSSLSINLTWEGNFKFSLLIPHATATSDVRRISMHSRVAGELFEMKKATRQNAGW